MGGLQLKVCGTGAGLRAAEEAVQALQYLASFCPAARLLDSALTLEFKPCDCQACPPLGKDTAGQLAMLLDELQSLANSKSHPGAVEQLRPRCCQGSASGGWLHPVLHASDLKELGWATAAACSASAVAPGAKPGASAAAGMKTTRANASRQAAGECLFSPLHELERVLGSYPDQKTLQAVTPQAFPHLRHLALGLHQAAYGAAASSGTPTANDSSWAERARWHLQQCTTLFSCLRSWLLAGPGCWCT